jgi:hypothetical protein
MAYLALPIQLLATHGCVVDEAQSTLFCVRDHQPVQGHRCGDSYDAWLLDLHVGLAMYHICHALLICVILSL